MKPKPIFIIGLPEGTDDEAYDNVSKRFRKTFDDYHTIVFIGPQEEPTFQVFYEKDFNKVKYMELKQIVKDSLKTVKL